VNEGASGYASVVGENTQQRPTHGKPTKAQGKHTTTTNTGKTNNGIRNL
jgi:hypothetical protein